jgi:hypothetical protein
VRLPESNCPFCGGELNAAALGVQYASRRGAVPNGIKRAALMAIGTVAAACGGKTDGTNEGTAPIVATESGTSGDSDPYPAAIPIYGASPVSSEAVATSNDETSTPTLTPTPQPTFLPVYGAPIPPSSSGPVDTDPVPTSDGEPTDGEFTGGIAPPYGIPPWDPTSDVVVTSAPPIEGDAGVDGGANADAGSDDLSTAVDDWTNLAQPEYGAPIPEQ